MVKEEEGIEDECSRSHIHGQSTVTVTEFCGVEEEEEERVEEEMFAQQFCGLSGSYSSSTPFNNSKF